MWVLVAAARRRDFPRHRHWPAAKANRVLVALFRIGWRLKRQSGSHRTLSPDGWPDAVFAFHDEEDIGPKMLSRIARKTGLTRDNL